MITNNVFVTSLSATEERLIVKAEIDDYQRDVSVIKDSCTDFVNASENVSK